MIAVALASGCRVGFEPLAGDGALADDAGAAPPPTVTLRIEPLGSGAGVVHLDGGPACALPCTTTLTIATPHVVTASAAPGAWFEGWAGAGCGGRGACALEVSADVTLIARFQPEPNRVFVSSVPTTGALGGLAGADAFCQGLATAAGLTGTFEALLHDGASTGMARLAGGRGFIGIDGAVVFDLPGDRVRAPIHVDETGAPRVATRYWAPTDSTTSNRCAGWTSASASDVGRVQDTDRGHAYESGGGEVSCDTPSHLLCAQHERIVPVAPTPTPGRLAFVTSSAFTPGGGRAAADALCASEAATAGWTGAVVAFLSTSTEAGTARLPVGLPWVRPDGQVLAPTIAELTAAFTAAPVQTAAGADLQYGTILLGDAAPGTLTSTCQDWASTGGVAMVSMGATWVTSQTTANVACSTPFAVLCLAP